MRYEHRLRPVIDSLIVAQRALTRAIVHQDPAARKLAREERDRAVQAIDEAFNAIEIALATAEKEQQRLTARELNLSRIIAAMQAEHPELVSQVVDDAFIALDDDARLNEAYLTLLGEAVEMGLAVRRRGSVQITFAGAQELVAAKRVREECARLKAKTFTLEQLLRSAELPSSTQSSANSQPRQAAVGA